MKLGIIMDPIERIKIQKDSSFAMLLAAQSRGWELHYMVQGDLFLDQNQVIADICRLQVADNTANWFEKSETERKPLADLDVILMRKDPPFDLNYIYTTYLLDHAQRDGVLVLNNPQALRQVNEKFFITHFSDCIAPTRISSRTHHLLEFLQQHQQAIIKPLDGMGGQGIFKLDIKDPNKNVIFETLTNNGQRRVMIQQFLPDIAKGDKRILLINGEPIPYALARIPADNEFRGNLAKGGTGKGVELSERDKWICAQVGPTLKEMGLIFVGLDVIGDYLTEINVTSPTCIRELDNLYNINIANQLMDAIQATLSSG